jgi:hypothetical protein
MLVSSVSDLVKWDAALDGERLLKKSSLDQMWTPTKTAKTGESGYGFGWQIEKVNGHRVVAHGGGIPGFSTEFWRSLDDRLTVIVLTNSGGGHAGALAQGIAGRIIPALAKKSEVPIEDTDPETTNRFKAVLLGAAKGEVDSELFTDQMKKTVVPRIKQDKERLARLGALKSFQLLEKQTTDQGVRLRYRAWFEKDTVIVTFSLDKDGKIAGLGLQPEDS